MAIERSNSLPEAPRRRWGIAEWLFAVLLLLVLVGLEPLRSRDALSMIESGDGDPRRQIAYLLLFGLLTALTIDRRGFGGLTVVPVMITLTIAWFFASTLWSVAPGITFRRATLTAVIVWSVFMSVGLLGAEQAWQVLYSVLAALLVVNLISIAVFPQAVHPPGEADPALVGNWRGVLGHKNTAGHFAAICGLVFLFERRSNKRISNLLLFTLSIIFLLGSKSKTSLFLFIPAIAILFLTMHTSKRKILWIRFKISMLFAAFFLVSMFPLIVNELNEYLSDPKSLTGRAELWQLVVSYAREHPLLGSGYGAFWDSGYASPALDFATDWVRNSTSSHNGYLEILASTGFLGLLLGTISAIFLPTLRLMKKPDKRTCILFSLTMFFIFYNFFEARLFQTHQPAWVFQMIFLSIIYSSERHQKSYPLNR